MTVMIKKNCCMYIAKAYILQAPRRLKLYLFYHVSLKFQRSKKYEDAYLLFLPNKGIPLAL